MNEMKYCNTMNNLFKGRIVKHKETLEELGIFLKFYLVNNIKKISYNKEGKIHTINLDDVKITLI